MGRWVEMAIARERCGPGVESSREGGPHRIRTLPRRDEPLLLRTKAELGHEAGEIEVLVNFRDLSALKLENPGHFHTEGLARCRDCLSAGPEQGSLVRPRAGGLQTYPVALAEAPVFLCSKIRKRPIELF